MDEAQTLKQGGQNPPHGQLQQSAPNIGVIPPQAPIVNQDLDFNNLEYYNPETKFFNPEEVPHNDPQPRAEPGGARGGSMPPPLTSLVVNYAKTTVEFYFIFKFHSTTAKLKIWGRVIHHWKGVFKTCSTLYCNFLKF